MEQLYSLLKHDHAFENLAKQYPEPDKFRAFVWSDELWEGGWYEVDFKRLVADTESIWEDSIPSLTIVPKDALDAAFLDTSKIDQAAQQALKFADVDEKLCQVLKAAKFITEDKYQLLLAHCHYYDIDDSLGNDMSDACDADFIANYHQCWLTQIARYERHIAILNTLCQRFPENVCQPLTSGSELKRLAAPAKGTKTGDDDDDNGDDDDDDDDDDSGGYSGGEE